MRAPNRELTGRPIPFPGTRHYACRIRADGRRLARPTSPRRTVRCSTQNAPANDNSGLGSMLADSGPTVAPATGGQTTVMPQGGYVKDAGNCDNNAATAAGATAAAVAASPWYASFDFLYMTRNQPNKVYTSARTKQPSSTRDTWTRSIGRPAGRRQSAIASVAAAIGHSEATYWGLAESDTDGPAEHHRSLRDADDDGLGRHPGTTGGGGTNGDQTANNYTDNSPDHHILREWQVNNVEVNLVKNCLWRTLQPLRN